MGTVIDFPAGSASRRLGSEFDSMPREGLGTLIILPRIRVERLIDEPTGNGPEQGTTPGGRRRRRART